ncbi:MAG: DEAD/DEAH box helicase, partial [Acidobacteriota bacterium]
LINKALERFVDSGVRQRGTEYFRAGRVLSCEVNGEVVYCSVRGSTVYEVELTFEDSELGVACSCPYFWENETPCKHIWAALLDMSARDLIGNRVKSMHTHDPLEEEDDPESDHPRQSGTRSQPVRVPEPPRTQARWMSVLEAVRRSSTGPFEATSDAKLPEEIQYIVRWSDSARFSIGLEVRQRSRKKNGEWGQGRRVLVKQSRIALLERADREILLLLNATSGNSYREFLESDYHLRPDAAALLIERMAGTERLFAERADRSLAGPLLWDDGEPWQLRIEISQDGSGDYALDGSFVRGEESVPLQAALLIAPHLLITESAVAPLEESDALGWVDPLRKSGRVNIPATDRDALLARLIGTSSGVHLAGDLTPAQISIEAVPVFRLSANSQLSGESLEGRVFFRYGEREAQQNDPTGAWIDEGRVVRRDAEAERSRQQELVALGVNRNFYGGYMVRPSSLGAILEALVRKGWLVDIDGQRVRVADDLESEVTSGIDWFGIEGRASFGEQSIELPELLSAFERRRPMITLEDGTLGILPAEWLQNFSGVAELSQRSEKGLRFRRQQALLIDALLAERHIFRDKDPLSAIKSRITGAQDISPVAESERFRGELRPYQREGLGWLIYLRNASLGGCLADDMGLGKTVQVLALLDQVTAGGDCGPSLVVAPRSLLFNWKKEAERFTPHLRVLEHHGPDRVRDADHFGQFDLVLTTYATMRLDVAHFRDREFEYVILDEAQAVKNASSQVAKSVRLLRSRHRLALSGTPIENHIGELWSLFEFLDPGMLGASRWFQRTFAAKNVSPERRGILGSALRPLILRRTKEQVAPELPPRTEQTLYCELEGAERKQYDELRQYYRDSLIEKIKVSGLARSKMHVLEALLRLRQAASHPGLLPGSSATGSAKMELLMGELAEIVESGHRALVFSQFTSFLALVREQLDKEGIEYCYLDGATRRRDTLVETFQRENGPPLFLISLKAGGLGLNLTAADYVFLLDPWWNPAVEAQAIDRAHRIGQQKPVVAYRLIARDTVEEKILDLQSVKRELAGSVITDENSLLQSLDAEQLEKLLS